MAVPDGASGLEQTAHGEDVGLQFGELRRAHAELPDPCPARAYTDYALASTPVEDVIHGEPTLNYDYSQIAEMFWRPTSRPLEASPVPARHRGFVGESKG